MCSKSGRDGQLMIAREVGKWSFSTGLYVSSSPAVATDGTVYFGSQDRYFYALLADGSLKWKLWTDSPVVSSPAITEDGAVVICTKNRVIAIAENNGGPSRSGWQLVITRQGVKPGVLVTRLCLGSRDQIQSDVRQGEFGGEELVTLVSLTAFFLLSEHKAA